jgi:hypothetical protein
MTDSGFSFSGVSLSDIFTPKTEHDLIKLLTSPQDGGMDSPLANITTHMADFFASPEGSQLQGLMMRAFMNNAFKSMPRAPGL